MNPLLLPVAALQGVRVKARTEVLPAASGPLTGVAEPPEAEPGAQLRVGVLGESTAAGCGVDSHEERFTGYQECKKPQRTSMSWGLATGAPPGT